MIHAPTPAKKPKQIEQLGFTRMDEYAWLKDENWQKILVDPSVLHADIANYLKEENQYTQTILKPTEPLQETLFQEIKGRLTEKETYPAYPHGPWLYYYGYPQNGQHLIYQRHLLTDENHQYTLLDVNRLATQSSYCKVIGATHSPNHEYFAYALDQQGSEIYKIFVKEIETDRYILETPIDNSTGQFVFSADSQYIFWVYRDDNGRPSRLYRHHLPTNTSTLIYTEQDAGFFVSVSTTSSGQWIYVNTHDHDTSETWILPSAHPLTPLKCVRPRTKGIIYDMVDWNDHFVIRTNDNGASDFKLMLTPITSPEKEYWAPLIDHKPGHYIIDMIAYRHHLVYVERHEAQTHIRIGQPSGQWMNLPYKEDSIGTFSLDGSLEYDTTELRYGFQSPTTPRQWCSFDMNTHTYHILKETQIPSGHNPDDYQTARLYAPAEDGELIPITLTCHKDTPHTGEAPLLLYGYGSYSHAIDPLFSISALSLLNRGWYYAIAHVRGGSEKGWQWFLDGRGAKKRNTFTDFISCASFLCEQKYTKLGHIVADGRSAGGMLMGAIANMRPELFSGIIAVVPFVDVLNTMSDESLPLTPPEWPEWGNPLTDKDAYRYIASYSPYDNISNQPYPKILAVGGLTDPRVTYWEPAKWVARLRDHTTGTQPILLKINMEAGHGGASGRYDSLRETALLYAFAIWAVQKE